MARPRPHNKVFEPETKLYQAIGNYWWSMMVSSSKVEMVTDFARKYSTLY
jgi:hypothetical protein